MIQAKRCNMVQLVAYLLASSTNGLIIQDKSSGLLPDAAYETILNGKIAVVPEFMATSEVAELQKDSESLYRTDFFSTDALASYGSIGSFDPTKDRAVLKLARWKDQSIGNSDVRRKFERRMQDLRLDLSKNLNRPALVRGDSVNMFGAGSTEISYTRFGPGAFLRRHVDEHHEELKGVAGWTKPTRRSLSWLVYLNQQWNADKHGGCLRCFERPAKSRSPVGARPNGDVQIAWLKAIVGDPFDIPVFMDAQVGSGKCSMYTIDVSTDEKNYVTRPFSPNPILFATGSETLIQNFVIKDRAIANRFHLIESPRNAASDWLASRMPSPPDEQPVDVPPLAGTLVVFDSVALPHEVLPTTSRERWACSGWMHEDQQSLLTHPDYSS